jgi:hypothetical protein
MTENAQTPMQDPEGILAAEKQIVETNKIRDTLINKLLVALDGQELNLTNISAENKEAIMSVINATGSLLNSKDGAVINIVKLKLASKKEDREMSNSAIITELLDRISILPKDNGFKSTPADIDVTDKLDAAFEQSGETISEGEMLPVNAE